MAFRFRRSLSLFPGLRLNFGKRGASFSVGRRGASVTMSERGVHGNLGLPGSGLSYRARLDGTLSEEIGKETRRVGRWALIVAALFLLGALLSVRNAYADEPLTMCEVSVGAIVQFVQAGHRAEKASDPEDAALYACMRRSAALIAISFRTACQSTVPAGVETPKEAFQRIGTDMGVECIQQARLRARLKQ